MPVYANLLLHTINRFAVITNRDLVQEDKEVILEEWVRAFCDWDEEHFLEVVEVLKKTCTFFPKIAEFYAAGAQLSRKIDNKGVKEYGAGAPADRAKLWTKLGALKRAERWEEALDVVFEMQEAGVDQKWTNPLITEINARISNDFSVEAAVLGAYYDASRATGYPLGNWLIEQQKRVMAGEVQTKHTSSGTARHFSDEF